ncbi:uncharacterized protein CANTADRAFT_230525 [Suhomyces tanzawaensis NRRL Y-17324]|uniref:Uncharacterized protein n=1 Tax=Suhomyces tanzawaensis NRRL Y-17324 TaxID=984487 RepID=A0A1E4SL77_9ASCO|nr:uncharacterized protein CANTADRAFT_230525 [Suhomyces tanzawaensis NRRL Y-17324]ODV80256.1 hypothetical protein CANTADRAFT_230525 [Suhomyces tanzawaensis NRRL Y-17324]
MEDSWLRTWAESAPSPAAAQQSPQYDPTSAGPLPPASRGRGGTRNSRSASGGGHCESGNDRLLRRVPARTRAHLTAFFAMNTSNPGRSTRVLIGERIRDLTARGGGGTVGTLWWYILQHTGCPTSSWGWYVVGGGWVMGWCLHLPRASPHGDVPPQAPQCDPRGNFPPASPTSSLATLMRSRRGTHNSAWATTGLDEPTVTVPCLARSPSRITTH